MLVVSKPSSGIKKSSQDSKINGYLVFDEGRLDCVIQSIDTDVICVQSCEILPILEEGSINISFEDAVGETVLNKIPVEVRSTTIVEDSCYIQYDLEILLNPEAASDCEIEITLGFIGDIANRTTWN